MHSKFALGIDLGGTDIKVGVVDKSGKLLDFSTFSTPKTSAEEIVKRIVEVILAKESEYGSLMVGIGVPGIVDISTRELVMAPNLVSKGYPLRRGIEDLLGKKIVIDNDANFAALGEWWMGAGKNHENGVLLTLGTGIGAGVIIGNKLFKGSRGLAGEVGHTIVFPEGEECACGKKGCLETYASAGAIARRYSISQGIDVNTEKVFELARQGNDVAYKIIQEAVDTLSIALYNFVLNYDPQCVVLGGGMIQAGNQFLIPLRKKTNALLKVYPGNHEIEIRLAELENKAGIFGAAKAVFDMN